MPESLPGVGRLPARDLVPSCGIDWTDWSRGSMRRSAVGSKPVSDSPKWNGVRQRARTGYRRKCDAASVCVGGGPKRPGESGTTSRNTSCAGVPCPLCYPAGTGELRSGRNVMADDGIVDQRTAVAAYDPVHYPDSDGHFLPENPKQAAAILNLRLALKMHFQDADNVVLEGDMFLYYKQGDPTKSIAPDVFVVLDHNLGGRGTYKLWLEGKPPDFALEVVSPESETRNHEDKRRLYARLGIKEYFVFQPETTRPEPRLVGHRLWGRRYVPLQSDPEAALAGELRSERLGVSLRPAGELLRVRDLSTGEDYVWDSEVRPRIAESNERARAEAEARQAANERARSEAEARRVAEAEAARLKALLAEAGVPDLSQD